MLSLSSIKILAVFCHPFDLQADKIACPFKRNVKVRFYKFTRHDDDLLLSTEAHVLKGGNKVIGGIASNSRNWNSANEVKN